MSVDGNRSASWWVIVSALVLIVFGGFLAHKIQTIGGIDVRDVRFVGSEGKIVSALLYVPPNATSTTPAPGIVATHGYINSRETQTAFAIEFARRGYVVLAPDQPGHGFSDPPAFNRGFGGMDTLAYLGSLDIVDKDNIGLEGHSMGGWASLVAAAVNPEGYRSMVLASSSPGTYGTPPGTPTFPRNTALIFSTYDEFSGLMWGVPVPRDIVHTDKLKTFFDTDEAIQPGKLYGSIEEGTARMFYQPTMIHPRVHLSTEAVGHALEWMGMTLEGGRELPLTDQVWYWKEIGTLVALIGMILLLFPLGRCLLNSSFFSDLQQAPAERKAIGGFGRWVSAILMVLIPVPVYIWVWTFHGQGIAKPTAFWPQQISTTVALWALVVGIISLALMLLWHFLSNRKKGATFENYGLLWRGGDLRWTALGKSLLLSLVVVLAAYLTLAFSAWAFTTDYRFWVFAVKPMTAMHARIALCYLIPFAFFFFVIGLVLHGQMRPGGKGPYGEPGFWKEAFVNMGLLLGAPVVFLALQYAPLFAGGSLMIPDLNLAGIVLFQFVAIFIIAGLVSTYFYRLTGRVYTGAFINALMVAWIVAAGQATHFPL